MSPLRKGTPTHHI
ncbi:UNVERIFIED_CONTAM: hypothetical protein GTU68_001829 [Idotea baltica]|nr:hypothetical protein [Idotea baltica]